MSPAFFRVEVAAARWAERALPTRAKHPTAKVLHACSRMVGRVHGYANAFTFPWNDLMQLFLQTAEKRRGAV